MKKCLVTLALAFAVASTAAAQNTTPSSPSTPTTAATPKTSPTPATHAVPAPATAATPSSAPAPAQKSQGPYANLSKEQLEQIRNLYQAQTQQRRACKASPSDAACTDLFTHQLADRKALAQQLGLKHLPPPRRAETRIATQRYRQAQRHWQMRQRGVSYRQGWRRHRAYGHMRFAGGRRWRRHHRRHRRHHR